MDLSMWHLVTLHSVMTFYDYSLASHWSWKKDIWAIVWGKDFLDLKSTDGGREQLFLLYNLLMIRAQVTIMNPK